MNAKPPSMCVYCGTRKATTADHVVPKCLFPTPLPKVMVTVPACLACNSEKAEDDTYLRDMLVIDLDNAGHAIADGVLKRKLMRSVARNSSSLARDIIRQSTVIPTFTPGGLYLGHQVAAPLQYERLNREFARITRGLYYQLRRARLPDDCVFDIRRVDRLYHEVAIRAMLGMGVKESRSLGQVFECMQAVATEDRHVTFWLMRFFNVFITVGTSPADAPDSRSSEEPTTMTSWLGTPPSERSGRFN